MHNFILNIVAFFIVCIVGLALLAIFSKNKPEDAKIIPIEDYEEFWLED